MRLLRGPATISSSHRPHTCRRVSQGGLGQQSLAVLQGFILSCSGLLLPGLGPVARFLDSVTQNRTEPMSRNTGIQPVRCLWPAPVLRPSPVWTRMKEKGVWSERKSQVWHKHSPHSPLQLCVPTASLSPHCSLESPLQP